MVVWHAGVPSLQRSSCESVTSRRATVGAAHGTRLTLASVESCRSPRRESNRRTGYFASFCILLPSLS